MEEYLNYFFFSILIVFKNVRIFLILTRESCGLHEILQLELSLFRFYNYLW